MSDLWLLIPAGVLTACAALALRWNCHALSIVLSVMAGAALVVLL
jgi:hypothetical protein